MQSQLVELDSLEVVVIVDNIVDPFSRSPCQDVIKVSGGMGDVAMRTPPTIENTRGDATRELKLDDLCCGAHGLSLMVVCFSLSYLFG